MSNQAIGTFTETEQPRKFTWDPKEGPRTIRVWHGNKEAMDARAAIMIGAKWSVRKDQILGTDKWQVEASAPISEEGEAAGVEIVDTWELLPKDAAKSLLQSDASAVLALSGDDITRIKKVLDESWTSEQSPAYDDVSNSLAVLALLKAGVESWEVEQPVLTHTWAVPYGMNLAYAYSNIGRIYSTATLFSSESIPVEVTSGVLSWVSQFSNPTRTDGVSLVWGWKKRAPQQRVVGNNRSEIVQTWEFGLWSTLLYQSAL